MALIVVERKTPIQSLAVLLLGGVFLGCNKKSSDTTVQPSSFYLASWSINEVSAQNITYNVSRTPSIKLDFSAPVNQASVQAGVSLKDSPGNPVSYSVSYANADKEVILKPSQPLSGLSRYKLSVLPQLKSTSGGSFTGPVEISFVTTIDSSSKFPVLSDEALLTLVQQQTFKYFWDFAHPTSGLARERNTSGDVVTTGGSGFGIMAILVAVHRQFITRAEGLARLQKIVSFLKNTAQNFHGAFPHWLNGTTGAVVPFGEKDNGADLVETSYLMQGLLTARQFFNGPGAEEIALRNDINALWEAVEWSWFRKNGENVLYWHWSPNYEWAMNFPIKGWNECLIAYVLAASSPTYTIPKEVYDNGFAQNGGIRNGNSYYGIRLPLGPPYGGPLFFAHYSFLGINPNNLSDAYANYWEQNRNHTLINYTHCTTNPKGFFGYSDQCWGLTASDDPFVGYRVHEPANDNGVISPTAALSSFPYTPAESMKALKFFYYTLGDKLWKDYGFVDAFSLQEPWFANSFLAIDQGPIIVMIENYRSGLLWDLFMSCPEVKTGMRKLGFQSPNL